jgi:hypothetical protein
MPITAGQLVSADGILLMSPDNHAFLCPEAPIGMDGQPGCAGADLVPLEPGRTVELEAWVGRGVTILGYWDGVSVRVDSVKDRTLESDDGTSTPACATPSTGWATPATGEAVEAQGRSLESEVRRHPETYSGTWTTVLRDGDGTIVAVVLNVGTVGDLETVERSLGDLYPHNLCVMKVAHSAAALRPILSALAKDPRWHVSIDARAGLVRVSVLAITASEIDSLAGYNGFVDVRQTLRAVDTP